MQERYLVVLMAALLGMVIATGCAPQGPVGAPGSAGINGSDGHDGQDGNDATPVTIVKLCPGTTSYPVTFVEIAFCVGGKLYGTYSANGGFSTELPPGNYNSNAIGSSCNFTILPNCEIQ